jgi:hypothetical protein
MEPGNSTRSFPGTAIVKNGVRLPGKKNDGFKGGPSFGHFFNGV